MPILQYSRTRPEDLDTDGEDHIADEVRYMCMARPIKPKIEPITQEYDGDPLNLLGDQKIYSRYGGF